MANCIHFVDWNECSVCNPKKGRNLVKPPETSQEREAREKKDACVKSVRTVDPMPPPEEPEPGEDSVDGAAEDYLNFRDEIIKRSEKDFVKDVDGYIYFWPSGGGHFASEHLRIIADELDKRNEPWEKEVKKIMVKR